MLPHMGSSKGPTQTTAHPGTYLKGEHPIGKTKLCAKPPLTSSQPDRERDDVSCGLTQRSKMWDWGLTLIPHLMSGDYAVAYPSGLFDCQRQLSAHMRSKSYSAIQPSSSRALSQAA